MVERGGGIGRGPCPDPARCVVRGNRCVSAAQFRLRERVADAPRRTPGRAGLAHGLSRGVPLEPRVRGARGPSRGRVLRVPRRPGTRPNRGRAGAARGTLSPGPRRGALVGLPGPSRFGAPRGRASRCPVGRPASRRKSCVRSSRCWPSWRFVLVLRSAPPRRGTPVTDLSECQPPPLCPGCRHVLDPKADVLWGNTGGKLSVTGGCLFWCAFCGHVLGVTDQKTVTRPHR